MRELIVNTRVLHQKTTGVQRYTQALLSRMEGRVKCVSPRRKPDGLAGHAWEQFVLPSAVRGGVLFSPSNTGPLLVRRQVLTLHDLTPLEHPEWLNPNFARWYRFLLPRLARKAARVITGSRDTKRRIMELCGVPEEKIEVIYHGVDASFAPCGVEAIDQVRERYAIPAGDYVVAVGTLSKRKNLGRLLLAWQHGLRQLTRDTSLVLVGGEGSAGIFGMHGLGQLPPRVVDIGHVGDADMPAIYSGAIASVFPSLYEGFGLPPLESMACGTPVVASTTTSIPEVVGDAGVLVDPHDFEAISDGLLKVIQDDALRAILRKRGLARSKQFDWDTSARRTLAILDSVS